MGIINYIEFGGVKSSDYGIYVSGEGTFNAPERDVELIEIPGRNGEFSLDKGRFKNITVTYPVFNYETNLTDFRTRLSDFRNALKSKLGYQRLEDTFHPDEYRMATFVDMIDVNPVMYNTASTIELTFNCKPQRFLKSGETAQAVASGGTITNPTLFESSPLLMARGYGDISFNNSTVTINNTVVGDTILLQPFSGTVSAYEDYGDGLVNTGDTITVAQGSRVKYTLKFKNGIDLIGVIVGDLTGKPFTVTKTMDYSNRMVVLEAVFSKADFTAGTDKTVSSDFTVNIQYTENGLDQSTNMTLEPGIYYRSNTRTIDVYGYEGDTRPSIIQYVSIDVRCQQVTAYSTVSTLGDPTYIDLDIGEAYKMANGEAVSLNNSVSIGSTLPTLAVGENTITYPNTITSLEVIPRWWRV